MTAKNILIVVASTVALSGISGFVASEEGICGVVRNDGSICQKLAGGKKACEELGYKHDSKKNCCIIN